uniref:U26-Liphistoxin-Lsp1a_1 n=2 Tax=Liphistius TaxID=62150 RepID=A0A4Q8K0V7_9ARAC
MASHRPFLIFLMTLLVAVLCSGQFWEVEGQYCSLYWSSGQCCSDRDDECVLPIMDTFCYCDSFCARRDGDDCCPDFWEHCLGEPKRRPESDLDYVRHYGRPRG